MKVFLGICFSIASFYGFCYVFHLALDYEFHQDTWWLLPTMILLALFVFILNLILWTSIDTGKEQK